MAPEPICPVCGTPLMESRGKLVCPSREHAPYAETCCEGSCGCAGIEGGDFKVDGGSPDETLGETNGR